MEITIRSDAPRANRLLLALERLDQESGLDPALAELRDELRQSLVSKSSGAIDGAPSTE